MRPYYAEGSKTLGYEVAEQLGWKAPDHCVVPAASGAMFTKIWRGLNEFSDLGLIDEVPTRMHIAQAEGCSPIVKAWEDEDTHVRPVKPSTIAKSLAIGNPADGIYALRTVKASNGSGVICREDQVAEGIQLLAETEGIFTETAGGVVISGLKNLVNSGRIGHDELTVAYITGNGLKTQEVMAGTVVITTTTPDYDSFKRNYNGAVQ
jgi:threonine synthase